MNQGFFQGQGGRGSDTPASTETASRQFPQTQDPPYRPSYAEWILQGCIEGGGLEYGHGLSLPKAGLLCPGDQ